jgi:nicotinamidase/pyrazinamidase
MNETVLLVVDVQNSFVDPDGSMYSKGIERIIPFINRAVRIMPWRLVVYTKDWHTPQHSSFATWPIHSVQGTWGSEVCPLIDRRIPYIELVKGYDNDVDSYSAFFDEDDRSSTGLDTILQSRRIKNVVVCGVDTAVCVRATALDSMRLGFRTIVLRDAVATHLDPTPTIEELTEAGVGFAYISDPHSIIDALHGIQSERVKNWTAVLD